MNNVLKAPMVIFLIIILALAASPALANHRSNPVGVACSPDAGQIQITVQVMNFAEHSSNYEEIYVNGQHIMTYDLGYGLDHGTYVVHIPIPGLKSSDHVRVTDGDTTVTTTCS